MKKLFFTLCTLLLLSSASLFATDYYIVSGAGSSVVNGTYVEDGQYFGKPEYAFGNYRIRFDNNEWAIMYPSDMGDDIYYTNPATIDTPPVTGWEIGDDGDLPVPNVRMLYSGGSGTSGDPYQIATTDDLIELSNTSGDWGAYFIQTANISFDANEENVDWDGDGSATWDTEDQKGFSPIGNSTTFTGSYDGQNYTIDGLYIERPQEAGIGLFGRVGNTTIRNLGITNADITGKFYTAVLIGSVYGSEQSSVENCSTSGIVNGETYVGGLIGHNAYNLYITGSHNEAAIQGNFMVGGLVGNNVDALEIETCYNTGNVHANSSDESHAGGLIGYNQNVATVSDSDNEGTVTGNGDYIGGLIGNHRSGQVDNCQNSGDVGDVDAGEFIGGLIGLNGRENTGPNTESLTNCSSSGNVTGSSRVGGLIGYNYSDNDLGPISSCTSTGDVNASGDGCGGLIGVNELGYIDDSHHTTGTVSGTNHVGGLVGSFHGEIYNSSSSGSVNGSGNYVGGFIGRAILDYNFIVNNYSNSSVVGGSNVGGFIGATSDGRPNVVTLKSSYCTGDVTGDDYVGGFIGLNRSTLPLSNSYSTGDVTRKSGSSGTNIGGFVGSNEIEGITNSYSTGSVYYEGASAPTNKGFAGADNGSSSNNFFDNDASNQSSATGATGLTTAQMQDYNSFTDQSNSWLTSAWDFVTNPNDDAASDDYWDMDQEGIVNSGYPILTWQDGADDILEELFYSGGSGTSGDPYQIATTEDLIELSNTSGDWDKHFIQIADIAFNADETQVDWNGDGSADGSGTSGFLPIGNDPTYFTGSYDGGGYTIDNLFINRPSTSYIGLFGYTNSATITDIGVTNVDITGNGLFGGLVGYNFFSSISNSYSTGSVNGDDDKVGGLVGYNSSSTVSNSYSTGSVDGNDHVGGLVGWNTSSTVSNSYCTGSVDGNNYVGGLVGVNFSSISNSYSTGSVNGTGTVGGLVAHNGGTVNNSFWDKITSGQNTSAGGTAKDTDEMQTRSTFTGWDFESIWSLSPSYNSGYPNLQNETDYTDITWQGDNEHSPDQWGMSGNWEPEVVPNSNHNVKITTNGESPVVSTGQGVECHNLTIESGATLTVKSGGSLITYGTITNNGTIKSELTYYTEDKWYYVSPPNNNTTANIFFNDYLQSWDETTAQWTEITDETTPLTPVKGYILYPPSSKYVFEFTGTPNTGEQSIGITYTVNDSGNDGANLVGNPYPSGIDWDAVSGYGAKYTYNGSGYDSYPQEGSYGSGDSYVAPMEGFFIVTGSNGTFSLNNNMRTHPTVPGKSNKDKSLSNGLVLTASSEDYEDELYVVFDESADENFELQRDAWKLLSDTEGISQLYSFSPDGKMSIDVRPMTNEIQLGFQNNQPGTYSIGIKEIADLQKAVLEDTEEHVFHDLTEGDYEFAWKTIDSETRFKLHLNTVGIEDEISNESQDLLIYANKQNIYLKTKENPGEMDVRVRDITGRTLLQKQVNGSGTITIPTSLQTSVYVVEVIQNQTRTTQKVVISE